MHSRLKFPGNLKGFFDDDQYFTGNFLLKRCAMFFSFSHRHAVLQGAASDLQKAFGFGVHPAPLPQPDSSNQFWVHMAFGSGRDYMVWPTLIVATSHRPHFRVIASFMARTKLVT
jgi:hypothetical protein